MTYHIRVQAVIQLLAEDPWPPAAKKLTARPEWRVRSGDFRILYRIEDDPRSHDGDGARNHHCPAGGIEPEQHPQDDEYAAARGLDGIPGETTGYSSATQIAGRSPTGHRCSIASACWRSPERRTTSR